MNFHELAGKPALQSILENTPLLIAAYYTYKPDVSQKPIALPLAPRETGGRLSETVLMKRISSKMQLR
jgi:hypothetical protein